MHDPQDDFSRRLEAVRGANPLPVAAERFGLTLRRSGHNFIARCPFHPDRRPSLSIFLGESGEWAFRCHSASCGQSGDLFRFVGLLVVGQGYTGRGEDFTAVLAALEVERGALEGGQNSRPRLSAAELPHEAAPRPEIDNLVMEVWDAALGAARELLLRQPRILDYLHGRGYSDAVLACWRFGWWPRPEGELSPVAGALLAAGYRLSQLRAARLLRPSAYGPGSYEFFAGSRQLSGRIVCADLDRARRPRYLLGRVLPWEDNGQAAKYLGPPDFAKPVLGIETLPDGDGPVALVEGFWNMITLRKWGAASVAVSGAGLSAEQTAALLALGRPLVPVRDMDRPNAEGVIPGLAALRGWQQALPGLGDGIELPEQVDGIPIKDVNDLDRLPDGRRIFRRLAARHGLVIKVK